MHRFSWSKRNLLAVPGIFVDFYECQGEMPHTPHHALLFLWPPAPTSLDDKPRDILQALQHKEQTD